MKKSTIIAIGATLIASSGLASSAQAQPRAASNDRLHAYGDQIRLQIIATTRCGASAGCMRNHLLSLTHTYTATFHYATSMLQNAPSDTCLTNTRPLSSLGLRALHATEALYADVWNATKIRNWGNTNLALVRGTWNAADALLDMSLHTIPHQDDIIFIRDTLAENMSAAWTPTTSLRPGSTRP